MPITFESSESTCVIRFAGEIDVSCSSELKRMLMETVNSLKDLRLDLENASDLDITTMQLIWAAARDLENAGKSLMAYGQVPEPLHAAIREAGFEKFPGLSLPNAPPAAEKRVAQSPLPAGPNSTTKKSIEKQ